MDLDNLPLPSHLLEAMAQTQQNPRYHAEGDVLAHTKMVLRKFFEMKDGLGLSPEEEQILYWAALLHDTGKTKTTVFEGDRWKSPGHEQAGLPIARNILLSRSELSPEAMRKVLDLVRWHGVPLYWSRQQRSLDELKQLGTQTDLRLLAIFASIDFAGRICEDAERTRKQIEHFRQITVPKAEYEFGKFDHLLNRFAGWNLRHKNAVWKAIRMRDTRLLEKLIEAPQIDSPTTFGKKVILTVGPPLSGKTTWLADRYGEHFRVSLDEHGVDESLLESKYAFDRKLIEFKHFLTIYLNRYRTVVLDGRNIQSDFRARLVEMIRGLNVEIEYLVFESSLDELLERNKRLERPLPIEDIRRGYEAYGLVHPWEAHRTEYVMNWDLSE